MSNRKISELTSLTAVAGNDVLPIVDISETDNSTKNKKITVSELLRSAPDGTAAAPAFSFESDDGNGVFLAGTDTVGISTGGTQRVTVDGSGNVTISGDLTVSGATTTVESTTVTIDDKNIELGSVASPSNTTADGGGITLKGATDKTIKWINSTGCWTFNQPLHITNNSEGIADAIQLSNFTGHSSYVKAGRALTLAADFDNNSGVTQSYISFETDASERLRITSSGDVGIGTASPSGPIEVVGTAANGVTHYFGTTSTAASADVAVALTTASGVTRAAIKAIREGSSANGNLAFLIQQSGTVNEVGRFDSSGRLGIGTSSPAVPLQVVGNACFGTAGAQENNAYQAEIRSGGNATLKIQAGATNTAYIGLGTTSDALKNNISLNNNTGDFRISVNSAVRQTILANGNVGIGTNSPSSRLTVAGDVNISGAANKFIGPTAAQGSTAATPTFSFSGQNTGMFLAANNILGLSTNGTEKLRINASGNVGIGTSSPDEPLDVRAGLYANNQDAGIQLAVSGGQWKSGLKIKSDGSGVPRLSLDAMSNATGGTTEALSIVGGSGNIAGNVGIGTTSPATKLAVNCGTDNAAGEFVSTDARVNIGFADNSTTLYSGLSGVRVGADGNNLAAYTTNTERLRIDSSGRLLLGTTTEGQSSADDFTIADSGDVGITIRSTDSNQTQISFSDGTSGATEYVGQIAYDHSDNHMRFRTSAFERMRISGSGNVGIGESSPQERLHIKSNASSTSLRVTTNRSSSTYGNSCIVFDTPRSNSSDGGHHDGRGMISCLGNSTGNGGIFWLSAGSASLDPTESDTDLKANQSGLRLESDGSLQHWASNNQRFGIDSSGNAMFGTTAQNVAVQNSDLGVVLNGNNNGRIYATANNHHDFNRTADGEIFRFRSATNVEGNISVSGSTVSYNGAHLSRWSQLAGGAERTEILRGSVLSNLDEMCEWGEEDNEQLNRMKVSDVEGDPNVSGVFQAWDDEDDTYINDFYCAMTGDFIIRIAQGTTVARGDLLMSAGDGTAKPQDDDIVRSKTIAKVTSTTVSTTYADGSYCVPCVLMAC